MLISERALQQDCTISGNAALAALTVILILVVCEQVTVVHSRNERQAIGIARFDML